LGPEKHVLIKEAQGKGHKISPAEVVNIWKTKHPIPGVKSDILFLEKGNKHSGLAHIVDKHSKEFLQKGVKESDIPHLIEKATTTGGPVGMQVTKKNPDGRPIFKTEHGGQEMHVASTIGSNGYVVGMNVAKDPTKTGKK
jgi:filamentous hemagglutinin